jgi:hypothetical protein
MRDAQRSRNQCQGSTNRPQQYKVIRGFGGSPEVSIVTKSRIQYDGVSDLCVVREHVGRNRGVGLELVGDSAVSTNASGLVHVRATRIESKLVHLPESRPDAKRRR